MGCVVLTDRISAVHDCQLWPTFAPSWPVASSMNCDSNQDTRTHVKKSVLTVLFPPPVGPITLTDGAIERQPFREKKLKKEKLTRQSGLLEHFVY